MDMNVRNNYGVIDNKTKKNNTTTYSVTNTFSDFVAKL